MFFAYGTYVRTLPAWKISLTSPAGDSAPAWDLVEGIQPPTLQGVRPLWVRERSAAQRAEERTKAAGGERDSTAQPRRRRPRLDPED